MSRFLYKGEPPRPGLTYGPTLKLRFRLPSGVTVEYQPVLPATEFTANADIGHEITDVELLRLFRTDRRFEEIK